MVGGGEGFFGQTFCFKIFVHFYKVIYFYWGFFWNKIGKLNLKNRSASDYIEYNLNEKLKDNVFKIHM